MPEAESWRYILFTMKKVVMLLVAVASATASFANTGTPLPTATATATTPALHQALAELKTENAVEALRRTAYCSVTVSSGGRSVTASGSCDCTQQQSCDMAYAIASSYL